MKIFTVLMILATISMCTSMGEPTKDLGPLEFKWTNNYVEVAVEQRTAWGTEYCDRNGVKTKTSVLMDPLQWAIKNHTTGCLTIKD